MPILLDTHAWMWWVTEDRRLSKRAAAAIREAADEGVSISAISIWEVAKKVEKKQLVLDRPLRLWLDRATRVKSLSVVELTTAVLIESCELPSPFHGDPADQMIVATARYLGAALVSKDRRLHRYPHVRTIW